MRRMFVLGLVALSACADEGYWLKPGATQQEFRAASYECERDTRMSAPSFGTGVLSGMYAREFYGRCMNTKGFYLQAKDAMEQRPAGHPYDDPGRWFETLPSDAPRQACAPQVEAQALRDLGVAAAPARVLAPMGVGVMGSTARYFELQAASANVGRKNYYCMIEGETVSVYQVPVREARKTPPWEAFRVKVERCHAGGQRGPGLAECAGPPPS